MTCSNLAEASKCRSLWGIMTLFALHLALVVPATSHRHTPTKGWMKSQNGRREIMLKRCLLDLNHQDFSQSQRIAAMIRGGADDDDESTDDESDEVSNEEAEQEEEEEAEESEDDEEEEKKVKTTTGSSSIEKSKAYDEPYFLTPTMSIFTTIFLMAVSKKFDALSPIAVRISRALFLLQVVIIQGFIIYVRIMAKRNNDRTPIVMENPISGMLKTQLDQAGNAMVKSLASSFLSSSTTIMEYDLRQASSMQGTIIFTMAFLWLLHFKMNMVQPLLQQIVTGFMNLAVSPLFQVYVLGRNLERPFKTPVSAAQKMAGVEAGKEEEATSDVESEKSEVSMEDKDDTKETENESDSEDGGDEDEEGGEEKSDNDEADAEEVDEESPVKEDEESAEDDTVEGDEEVKDEAKEEEEAK